MSTCSSFSVSPDGKIHGNVDELKELSVKIERLRDIESLSPAATENARYRVCPRLLTCELSRDVSLALVSWY